MWPVSGGTRFLGGARKEDIAATLAHLAELQLEPVILHMFQGGRDTVVSADFCGHLTDYIAPDIADNDTLELLFASTAHATGVNLRLEGVGLSQRAVTSALAALCTASISDVVDWVYKTYGSGPKAKGVSKLELSEFFTIMFAVRFSLTPHATDDEEEERHALHSDTMDAHLEQAEAMAESCSSDLFASKTSARDGKLPRRAFEYWFRDMVGRPAPEPKWPTTSTPAAVEAMKMELRTLDFAEVSSALFPNEERRVDQRRFCDALGEALGEESMVYRPTLAFLFGAMVLMEQNTDPSAVDIEVLTAGLATMCNARHVHITEAVFRVFDGEGSEALSRPAMMRFLHTAMEMIVRLKSCDAPHDSEGGAYASSLAGSVCSNIFDKIDADQNGSISRDEFEVWLLDTLAPAPATPGASEEAAEAAAAKVVAMSPPPTSTKDAVATLRNELSALDLLFVEDALFPDGARSVGQSVFCGTLLAMLGNDSAVEPATLAFLFGAIAELGGNSSVNMKTAILTGWLEKKRTTALGGWQPFFFALRGHTMQYKAKKKGTAWEGGVELAGEGVTIEQLKKGSSLTLRITGPSGVMQLRKHKAVPGTSVHEWFKMCTQVHDAKATDADSIDLEVATAALATLCNSSHVHVADVVYRVFDVERSNTLSKPEVERFLHTVMELVFRLRDCAVPCDAEHSATASRLADVVVEDMFVKIDLDGSGAVDRSEFEVWLQSVVSGGAPLAAALTTETTASLKSVGAMKNALANVNLFEVELALFPNGARVVSHAMFCDSMSTLMGDSSGVHHKTLSYLFGALVTIESSPVIPNVSIEVVVAALSTICLGNHEDVTKAVYSVFDTERSNTLSKDEVSRFLHVIFELTFRLRECDALYDGVNQHAERAERLSSALAVQMFDSIDLDHSGAVDRGEFQAWLRDRLPSSAEAVGDSVVFSSTEAAAGEELLSSALQHLDAAAVEPSKPPPPAPSNPWNAEAQYIALTQSPPVSVSVNRHGSIAIASSASLDDYGAALELQTELQQSNPSDGAVLSQQSEARATWESRRQQENAQLRERAEQSQKSSLAALRSQHVADQAELTTALRAEHRSDRAQWEQQHALELAQMRASLAASIPVRAVVPPEGRRVSPGVTVPRYDSRTVQRGTERAVEEAILAAVTNQMEAQTATMGARIAELEQMLAQQASGHAVFDMRAARVPELEVQLQAAMNARSADTSNLVAAQRQLMAQAAELDRVRNTLRHTESQLYSAREARDTEQERARLLSTRMLAMEAPALSSAYGGHSPYSPPIARYASLSPQRLPTSLVSPSMLPLPTSTRTSPRSTYRAATIASIASPTARQASAYPPPSAESARRTPYGSPARVHVSRDGGIVISPSEQRSPSAKYATRSPLLSTSPSWQTVPNLGNATTSVMSDAQRRADARLLLQKVNPLFGNGGGMASLRQVLPGGRRRMHGSPQ